MMPLDRASACCPAASAEAPGPYTADRSRSLAFGSTTILFGEAVTWDTLVRQSTERTEPLMLELGPTTGG